MTTEIGALLRRARVKRSLSLRTLASEIGVSASLISQVETGKTQPSVSTLYALTNFLGLSMDDLLGNGASARPTAISTLSASPEPWAPIGSAVQRGSDNPRLEMDNGVSWERLAVDKGGVTEPLLVTYAPGASSSIEGKLMRHSGHEYAYILEGELTMKLEFDTVHLSVGDSLQFDSVRPHMYTNHGTVAARGVWHIIGRRLQNEQMAEASSAAKSVENRLNSAVDVLHAMDRMTL